MLKETLMGNTTQDIVPSPQTNGHRPLKKACSNDPNALRGPTANARSLTELPIAPLRSLVSLMMYANLRNVSL